MSTKPIALQFFTTVHETPGTPDSGGKDVEIPADVTRVAPTIGAFSAVTAMLGASGKITAAATSALSPRFKATYPDYEKANPKGFDTKKGLSDKRCVGSGGFHQ